MHKLMKIVGHILAIIGLVYVVKQIMHCKEVCCLCGWHRTKEEKPEEKPAGSTVSHKIKVEEEKPAGSTESHKIKVEEKRQGTRYGSNPVRY